jgi:hypothetical protein
VAIAPDEAGITFAGRVSDELFPATGPVGKVTFRSQQLRST